MIPRIETKKVIIPLVVFSLYYFWQVRQAINGGVTEAWMKDNVPTSIDMRIASGSAINDSNTYENNITHIVEKVRDKDAKKDMNNITQIAEEDAIVSPVNNAVETNKSSIGQKNTYKETNNSQSLQPKNDTRTKTGNEEIATIADESRDPVALDGSKEEVIVITNSTTKDQAIPLAAIEELSVPVVPVEDFPNKTATELLLGCNDLKDATIVRTFGKGHTKAVYEVKLPSGESAIVKRNLNIGYQRYFENEVFYLKKMAKLYGDKTTKYFGECNAPMDKSKIKGKRKDVANKYLKSIASNFTGGGLAYAIQIGQPLVTKWEGDKKTEQKFRQCLASYFTPADLENFRSIARQYAAIPDHRLFFAEPGWTNSHVYAEQYALMDGTIGIQHIDLDNLHKCQKCSFEKVLEFNCATVRNVTFTPQLNCTEEYSVTHPVKDMNDHINATEANAKCAMHREK